MRILKLKGRKETFQGKNLWYKRRCPHWLKSVCPEWEGLAVGKHVISILFGWKFAGFSFTPMNSA
jgi:hypothetical protein